MKKGVLLLIILVTVALVASAQYTPPAGGSQTTAAGDQKELTGCIERGATEGTFVLKSEQHKDGVEISSREDLKAHVGHEVRLRGSWEKEPAAGEATGAAGAGVQVKGRFRAEKIEMVSETCRQASNRQ